MEVTPVLRDTRSLRPFKSSEEYLYAMKEDLAEWLQLLYPELRINVTNFMDRLDTGVALCKHANNVRTAAEEYMARRLARRSASSASLMTASLSATGSIARPVIEAGPVHFLPAAQPGTFFARDNVSNFIRWCRHALGVFECLLFETDDLILRKNERNVILCLLDVARRGAKFGMAAPMLVRFEREIDREMAAEQRALQRANSVATESADSDDDDDDFDAPVGPVPQIVTNDLKSLDEMVRDLVERCSCPVQFPMIRVSEGKYRIGDTKVLIFVRVLRSHVMVRVGGGWDTLSHYLDKHDPCRCKTAHRSPLSAKLILKQTGAIELNNALVHYERSPPRTRRSSASSVGSGGPLVPPPPPPPPPQAQALSPGGGTGLRSRSPTPRRSLAAPRPAAGRSRSRSPTPSGAKTHNSLVPTAATPRPQRSRDASPSPGKPAHRKDRERDVSPAPAAPPPPAATAATADAHNDSGSEVSDEGYRSLGTVGAAASPPAQGGDEVVKVVAEDAEVAATEDKDGGVATDAQLSERPELCRHASSPDSVVSTSEEGAVAAPQQEPEVEAGVEAEDPAPTSAAPAPPPPPPRRPASACSSASSDRDQQPDVALSPKRMASLQVKPQANYRRPSQQGSPQQQQQQQQPTAAPMARSRSTCGTVDCGFSDAPAELFASPATRRQQQQQQHSTVKGRSAPSPHPSSYNTWSGRQGRAAPKARPPLTDNTFSRSSVHRRSLGAYGGGRSQHGGSSSNNNHQHASAPCSPRRQPPHAAASASGGGKGSLPASLSGSPTKISPLIEQVLSVKELDNDMSVLNKMRQIIRQYADLVGDADGDADAGVARPPSEELDLTSAWVHGNGSLPRRAASVCGGDLGAMGAALGVGPSPRKDSKGSRIPAPLPLPLVSYGSRQLDS